MCAIISLFSRLDPSYTVYRLFTCATWMLQGKAKFSRIAGQRGKDETLCGRAKSEKSWWRKIAALDVSLSFVLSATSAAHDTKHRVDL